MPGDLSFRFTGGKELERALRRLPPKIEQKVGRQALRDGAKIWQKDIASKLPRSIGDDDTVHLADSVKVARIRGVRDLIIRVGVTGAARTYAHIIEYGNADVPAQPVWRPSFRRLAQKVVARVAAKLGADIIKEVRRGN